MLETMEELTLLLLRAGLVFVVTLVWMSYVMVVIGCKWCVRATRDAWWKVVK